MSWDATRHGQMEWPGSVYCLRDVGGPPGRELDVSALDSCDLIAGRIAVICAAMDLVDANGGDTDRTVRMIRMLTGADQNADDRYATRNEGWWGSGAPHVFRIAGCPEDNRNCVASFTETGEGRCDTHGRPT